MYIPKAFRETETECLHALVADNPFATLITTVDGRLEATHVPCLLLKDVGEHGALRFHLAARNPTAGVIADQDEVLVVFGGPHHYISPDWYAREHQVPTWNYVAVHAYGSVQRLEDAALCTLLDSLSAESEGNYPKQPWTTDKMPADLYAQMRNAIVGFEMQVRTWEGKWKLSQNRSDPDQRGAAQALRALETSAAAQVAALMDQANDR